MDQVIPEANRVMAGILLIAAVQVLQYVRRRPRRLQRPQMAPVRRVRRIWCRDWLLRRSMHGEYDHLLQKLNREDTKGYRNFLRIDPDLFTEMVERISPVVCKQETRMRHPLAVDLKLAVTLWFLATGNSYATLQYSFRVSKSAISRFVPKVCEAIIDTYKPDILTCPRTPDAWKLVAEGFARR